MNIRTPFRHRRVLKKETAVTGSTRQVWKATLFAALLAELLAYVPQLRAQDASTLE